MKKYDDKELDCNYDYDKADYRLNHSRKQDTKRVAPNTRLERLSPTSIGLRLYDAIIITWHENGDIILSAGGCWRTVTTKDRMNRFLPKDIRIWQESSLWYVHTKRGRALFEDNIRIPRNKMMRIYTEKELYERQYKIRKLRTYVKEYINALFSGKIPAPSDSDCWICQAKELDTNNTHLKSHIEEKYYVPSLLNNAVEEYPVSIISNQVVQEIRWGGARETNLWGDGIVRRQLTSSLMRYMKKHMGYTIN